MKYLCLVYIEQKKLDALSKGEYDALVDEARAYDEELRKSGHHVVSDTLQTAETATTVRIRNGQASASDGPFAGANGQLGAFVLISARDLNDAIRVASRIPPARLGCVEVRPIKDLCG